LCVFYIIFFAFDAQLTEYSWSHGLCHFRRCRRHVLICIYAYDPGGIRKIRQVCSSCTCTQGGPHWLYSHRHGRYPQSSNRVRYPPALSSPNHLTNPFRFIVTISAWTQAGCKNAENDPHAESNGKDFVNALPGWCNTKKAGAIFFWLTFSKRLSLWPCSPLIDFC
jgi:hypothetical protein